MQKYIKQQNSLFSFVVVFFFFRLLRSLWRSESMVRLLLHFFFFFHSTTMLLFCILCFSCSITSSLCSCCIFISRDCENFSFLFRQRSRLHCSMLLLCCTSRLSDVCCRRGLQKQSINIRTKNGTHVIVVARIYTRECVDSILSLPDLLLLSDKLSLVGRARQTANCGIFDLTTRSRHGLSLNLNRKKIIKLAGARAATAVCDSNFQFLFKLPLYISFHDIVHEKIDFRELVSNFHTHRSRSFVRL